jgi:FRG domain
MTDRSYSSYPHEILVKPRPLAVWSRTVPGNQLLGPPLEGNRPTGARLATPPALRHGHAFRNKWEGLRGAVRSALRFPEEWPHPELYTALAFAQHHGIPTRLLDWSWSGVVAAYFAAGDALKQKDAAGSLAVWALNTELLDSLYKRVELVNMPGANSRRLGAQRGLFTLVKHDSDQEAAINLADVLVSENEDPAKPKPLWKLSLPRTEAARLLYLCHLHGVDGGSVFPDPAGAAQAVLERTIWSRPDPATGHSAVTVRPVKELDIEPDPRCPLCQRT